MNIENRTIFEGDNLQILRRMKTASIDLIYLDPPFNSRRSYKAPITDVVSLAPFKDVWNIGDFKEEWYSHIGYENLDLYRFIEIFEYNKPIQAYLIMMAVRMLEIRRVLKSTGSIYLHCDNTTSHYFKVMMDEIFGEDNFKNEIIWHYASGPRPRKYFSKKHDTILFYTMSKNDYCFNVDDIPKVDDVWNISAIHPRSKERLGYPTQKPLELLERIIKVSSNEGDIVLDPFCGCATTCVAAEKLGRRWIGIDISSKAIELVKMRLGIELGFFTPVHYRTDIVDVNRDTYTREIKQILYEAQNQKCVGCLETFHLRNLTMDHVIPHSLGGTSGFENIQLLCQACNSAKGIGTMKDLADANLANGVITEHQYKIILDDIEHRFDPITTAQLFITHYEDLASRGFDDVNIHEIPELVERFAESEKILEESSEAK